jgi:hypothetical protein
MPTAKTLVPSKSETIDVPNYNLKILVFSFQNLKEDNKKPRIIKFLNDCNFTKQGL